MNKALFFCSETKTVTEKKIAAILFNFSVMETSHFCIDEMCQWNHIKWLYSVRLTSECRCYCGEPSHLWFNQYERYSIIYSTAHSPKHIYGHSAQRVIGITPDRVRCCRSTSISLLIFFFFFYDWSSRDECGVSKKSH